MNDDSQQNNNPHLLQSLVLIFLETILTFVLKHDRMVREYAKPFIRENISIHFNTFLPSDVFYVTFTAKGLLFDHQEPQFPKPQIMIYASTLDLFRALLTGSEGSIQRIRLTGAEHLHESFRALLRSMSLPTLLADWKNWLKSADNAGSSQLPKKTIEPLIKRIEQQQSKINKLTIQVKEQEYDLKELERKHKFWSRLYLGIIFILCISIAVLLCYNWL